MINKDQPEFVVAVLMIIAIMVGMVSCSASVGIEVEPQPDVELYNCRDNGNGSMTCGIRSAESNE